MEDQIKHLWTAFIWFAGISTTVTLAMFGYLIKVHTRIQIGESILEAITRAVKDLDEIKNALKGDYEKKGLITRHYDLEHRVEVIEKRII